MNKLWLLRGGSDMANRADGPWDPWYDKTFGMVVRAKDEQEARALAARSCAYEGEDAWLDSQFSTCVELPKKGESGVILVDHRSA